MLKHYWNEDPFILEITTSSECVTSLSSENLELPYWTTLSQCQQSIFSLYIYIMHCIMFVCILHSLRNIAFWFYSSWLVKILHQRLPVTNSFTIIVYRDVKHLQHPEHLDSYKNPFSINVFPSVPDATAYQKEFCGVGHPTGQHRLLWSHTTRQLTHSP